MAAKRVPCSFPWSPTHAGASASQAPPLGVTCCHQIQVPRQDPRLWFKVSPGGGPQLQGHVAALSATVHSEGASYTTVTVVFTPERSSAERPGPRGLGMEFSVPLSGSIGTVIPLKVNFQPHKTSTGARSRDVLQKPEGRERRPWVTPHLRSRAEGQCKAKEAETRPQRTQKGHRLRAAGSVRTQFSLWCHPLLLCPGPSWALAR